MADSTYAEDFIRKLVGDRAHLLGIDKRDRDDWARFVIPGEKPVRFDVCIWSGPMPDADHDEIVTYLDSVGCAVRCALREFGRRTGG